ncbi:MAG: hypothetical protein K6F82_00840 [Sphaerochaetaceae bacterium]|nr:hypothetical protein [Sphaerochaetaceae bacterium]
MKKLIKGLSVLLILVLLISCGGQKKEEVLKSSDGSYSVTINTEEELESTQAARNFWR